MRSKFRVSAGLYFCALAAAACQKPVEPAQSSGGSVLITNGQAAEARILASTVRIVIDKGDAVGTCTGTWLVKKGPNSGECVVLTAAHCTKPNLPASNYQIEFLTTEAKPGGQPEELVGVVRASYRAREVHANPGFEQLEGGKFKDPKVIAYDGAVLRFDCDPPAPFQPADGILPLAQLKQMAAMGQATGLVRPLQPVSLKMAGYGLIRSFQEGVPSVLASHLLQIVGTLSEFESFPPSPRGLQLQVPMRSLQLLVVNGRTGSNQGTCQGDSGGAAYVERSGGLYVAGILSGGLGPCEQGVSVYNLAENHQDWIKTILGRELPTGAANSGGVGNGAPEHPAQPPMTQPPPPPGTGQAPVVGVQQPPPRLPPDQMPVGVSPGNPVVASSPIPAQPPAGGADGASGSTPPVTSSVPNDCSGVLMVNSTSGITVAKLVDQDAANISDPGLKCAIPGGRQFALCVEGNFVRSTSTGNSQTRLLKPISGCPNFTAGKTMWLFRSHFSEEVGSR